MKKGKAKSVPAPDLRHMAEQRLREQKTEEVQPQTVPDTQRVLHELRVHQIELEMQNEQLTASRAEAEAGRAEAEAGRARYVDLYDFAPVGYFTLARDGTILQANLTAAGMLGVDRAKLVNLRLGVFLAEGSRPAFNAFLTGVFDGQAMTTCEAVIPREGRESLVVEIKATCSDGLEARVTVADISARKRAEELLQQAHDDLETRVAERTTELASTVTTLQREVANRAQAEEGLTDSEKRLRAILQTAMDGFWLADTQGRLLGVNDTYCRMSGYSERELLAMRIPDLEVCETAEDAAVHFKRIMEWGEDRFESRHRRKDGSIFDVEVSVQYQPGDEARFVAFLRDITERRRTHEQLAEQKDELRTVLASMDDLLFSLDMEGRFTHYYQAGNSTRLYAPPEQFIGKSYRDILPPEVANKFGDATEILLRTGEAQQIEYALEVPEGLRWSSARLSLRRDSSGRAVGITQVIRDITERVRIQEQRQASEARFRGLFEQSPVAMCEMDLSGLRRQFGELRRAGIKDLRGHLRDHPDTAIALLEDTRILAVNDAMVRLHGVTTREELLDRYKLFRNAETTESMVAGRVAMYEGAVAVQTPSVLFRADGQRLQVILSYHILPGSVETWERAILAIVDVTEIKEAQSALQSAHGKLMMAVEEERRRLAKDLHDSVAQDLVALEMSLHIAAGSLAGQSAEAEAVKTLQTAIGRCNEAVREIRAVCHGLYPPSLEMFGLIPSMQQLADRCQEAGIKSRLCIGPEIQDRRFGLDVEIAVFRTAQEALNNALRHSKGKAVTLTLCVEDSKLILSIKDSGKGFDPGQEASSGLGLISMRERATAVGGTLTIDSNKRGTTVSLHIPIPPA